MQVSPALEKYPAERVTMLLKQHPVFEWIHTESPEEMQKILPHCRLFRAQAGEAIIKKGEVHQWIFFVIQGGCFAYIDETHKTPVNHIKNGDILGELAGILQRPRSANVVVNYDAAETLLLGVDFKIFSYSDSETLEASTQLVVYRAIQQTIFQRISRAYKELEDSEFVNEAPKPVRPPAGFSDREKVRFYVHNCREAAKTLLMFSERLADVLNASEELSKLPPLEEENEDEASEDKSQKQDNSGIDWL